MRNEFIQNTKGLRYMNELISIIVPVYNVSKYLDRCIKSLLSQTYKNIEIILVNDGSTDDSGDICNKYDKGYENVAVIHKINEGLGYARNSGLDIAKGEYVSFVDSDDWVSERYIENLYKALKKYRVDYCKSGFNWIDVHSNKKSSNKYGNQIYKGKDAAEKLVPYMVGPAPEKYDYIEMSVCAVLYKLSLIKKHNLVFHSERELISEDMIFNIDYLQYANGACVIDSLDYNYVMNDSSLTHKYREDRGKAVIYFYNTVKSKLIELGYGKETIFRLNRLFFIYIRMSIAQERKSISYNKSKMSRLIIEDICSDKSVREAIKEYPMKKLGLKRRVFLLLVEKKSVRLLLMFANMGVLQ